MSPVRILKALNPVRMLKIVRWKYAAPRIAIAVAAGAALRFGLDPALKCAIIAGGESTIGAQVEVGELSSRLLGGELVLHDLAAANPEKPFKNLLEADAVRLHVDAGKLLHKRIVVRDGRIAGLRFDTPRAESGSLVDANDEEQAADLSALDPLVDAAEQRADAWFDDLSSRLEGDLAEKLETPQLADELQQRWPQEYEDLKQRADDLRARSKEIEAQFREVRKNPLRNLPHLKRLREELVTAEEQLRTITEQINQLPQRAEVDRLALEEARQRDQEFLKSQLQVDALDGEQLSRYLLGQETGSRVATAVSWVKLVRKLLPSNKPQVHEASQRRGVDVLFLDRPEPKWLVQRVELEGAARFGGQPLKLVGVLTDAASSSELIERPLRVEMTGAGPVDCQLVVEIDRRSDQPRDQFDWQCQAMQLAGRQLGDDQRMSFSIAPGEARLSANVTLIGDDLDGVVELSQSSVEISTTVARDGQLAEAMNQALGSLNAYEATVELSGTLDDPRWQLKTDLGDQMAASLNGAVKQYLQVRSEKLMATVRVKADEQLAALDAKRQQAQQELLAKLGDQQELIAQLTEFTSGGIRSGDGPSNPVSISELGKGLGSKILKR